MSRTHCALLLACAAAAAHAQPASPASAARLPVVQRIGEPPLRITDLATQGRTVWAATRGGGIVRIDGGKTTRVDVGPSLPSATVWSVQPWQDGLLAATDNGLVLLDADAASSRRLLPGGVAVAPSAQLSADFVRLSPRDGRPVVQLSLFDGTQDRSLKLPGLWRLLEAPLASDRLAGALAEHGSVAARDRASGCLDVAGVAQERGRAVVWVWTECRRDRAPRVTVFRGEETRDAVGVSAIARNPRTARPVLAVVQSRGPEPQRRRHLLLEATARGVLEPHCSRADYAQEVTALLPDPSRRGLVVALYGDGVHAVDCGHARRRLDGDAGPLRFATALAHGVRCMHCFLVGTDRGVYLLKDALPLRAAPMEASPVQVAGPFTLPEDAIPTDASPDGRRVLLSSAGAGVIEMAREATGWTPTRRWAPAGAPPLGTVALAVTELPAGVYGPASYGGAGGIDVLIRSQGLVHVDDAGARWLDRPLAASHPHVVGAKATSTGDVWLAIASTPAAPAGSLRVYPRAGTVRTFSLPDAQVEPTGSLLAWPDGRMWSASRSGIVEAAPDGRLELVSRYRVQSIFRNEAHPSYVAAVGATVERWTGDAFVPVPFHIDAAAEQPQVQGHPIDVVIDKQGAWLILYSTGHIVQLDPGGGFVRVLGHAQGIPPSARKLLYVPATDEVIVSAGRDGMFLLSFP